jgi:hypothetical protein
MRVYKFIKKVAKGLVSDMGLEIEEQLQAHAMSKDNFAFRILVTDQNKKTSPIMLCANNGKHHVQKFIKKESTTVYC